jgi:hypothetical protein
MKLFGVPKEKANKNKQKKGDSQLPVANPVYPFKRYPVQGAVISIDPSIDSINVCPAKSPKP